MGFATRAEAEAVASEMVKAMNERRKLAVLLHRDEPVNVVCNGSLYTGKLLGFTRTGKPRIGFTTGSGKYREGVGSPDLACSRRGGFIVGWRVKLDQPKRRCGTHGCNNELEFQTDDFCAWCLEKRRGV